MRGPGRGFDTSRDNEVEVQVRGGMTTTVIFFNGNDRDHMRGGSPECRFFWCHDMLAN